MRHKNDQYNDILEDIFNDDLLIERDDSENLPENPPVKDENNKDEITEKAKTEKPKNVTPPVAEIEETEKENTGDDDGDDDDDNESFSLVKELAKDFGLPDEELKDVAEDYQGITKTVKAVGEKLAKQLYSEFVEQYPGLPELHEYLANGGSLETYIKNSSEISDWTSITINKDDTEQHRKIVKEYIRRRGLVETDEELDAEVREIETSGRLDYALAEKAYNVISKQDKAKKAEIIQQQVAENERIRAESQQKWNITKDIVTKGQLDNFTIPPKDRDDFFKYIAVADEKGKAAIDKDLAKLTPTQYLELQYWIYKKGQLKDVIETKAKTLATERYRKVANPGVGSIMKTTSKNKTRQSENLDVNYLVN